MSRSLRSAIDVAPFNALADARVVVRLAMAAERSGWDGISVWDSLGVSIGTASADPFVTLAAVAQATSRLQLITSVVALPRRRPQLVAQAVGTLDRLSDGRCILGVGAGGDPGDFEPFGESFGARERMTRLDEGLELVDRWLRGETVDHDGPAHVARSAAVAPRPVQQPRPKIWVGGMKDGALRRAARWDGWIAIAMSADGSSMSLAPEAFGELTRRLAAKRAEAGTSEGAFDIAVLGLSERADPGVSARFAEQGASWWLESLSPMRGSIDDLLAIVEAGPPA